MEAPGPPVHRLRLLYGYANSVNLQAPTLRISPFSPRGYAMADRVIYCFYENFYFGDLGSFRCFGRGLGGFA